MFKRILVVLDGGQGWAEAATTAVDLARDLKCELVGAAIVDTDTLSHLLQRHVFVEEERAGYEQELENDAKRYLSHAEKLAKKAGVELETCVLKGNIHRVILQEAEARNVDAIVLASWTRSMLKRDLIPHERQLLLDEADCTAIVVKQKGGA